jgi:hypothetical protein
MLIGFFEDKLRELAHRWAIPGWILVAFGILWDIWILAGHASTAQSVWGWLHPSSSATTTNTPPTWAWSEHIVPNIPLFIGLLWLTAILVWPTLSACGSLLRRTRSWIKKLNVFLNDNEGNVSAIHFLYDAKFRIPIDKLFSELAAQEVCDVVEGDWVINPQVQTAKNIRENVIPNLARACARLEAKQTAPRSKLVGEIESGKFTVRGDGVYHGSQTHNANICVKLRVTNRENIETTVKRANLKIVTGDGTVYRGVKTVLWYPESKPDFLEKITYKTPIRHGPATVGEIEFFVDGIHATGHGLTGDVSVTLVDEFDVSHIIRNRKLWIAA